MLSHHDHQPLASRTVCDLCDMFDACWDGWSVPAERLLVKD